jgi:predicted DCC family thiol-disulfide oxidoreductase YuxK
VEVVEYKTVSAALFVGAVVLGIALAIRFRVHVIRAVRTFFSEPGTAFNLAVFRFVFFSTALALAHVPLVTDKDFAQLPRGLMVPPKGFNLVSSFFPISVTLVQIAFWIAVASSVFAAVGLFTRLASSLFLVSATYYLTIPQIFGKVVHYHTIIWVAAILTVSRTSDAMSLDAVIRARRSRTTEITPPPPHVAYARPIRLTWLLLAVSYLGPGLWKYRSAGIDWASASNMRGILYNKWYELGGYRPFVPVDKSGVLLTLGGLMTLGFELGFILLIWHRYTRALAAAMGLFFHTMNVITLHIAFYWAMILYVTFVNWERLSRWALRRRQPLVFAFDGGCGPCRKTAAALAGATLPGGVEYASAQELAESGALPAGVELPQLLTDVHVVTPTRSYSGYPAYRRIAWRVPFLWPVLPLLHLPPVSAIAGRVYRRIADHRVCHLDQAPQQLPAPQRVGVRRGWTTAPTLVAAVILAAMVAAIAADQSSAWPVALYPTFQDLHPPRANALVVVVRRGTAAPAEISLRSCFPWMPSDRYTGLVTNTVRRARKGNERLVREFVVAAARRCPQLRGTTETFSFYNRKVDTRPGQSGRLVSSSLLLRWTGTLSG